MRWLQSGLRRDICVIVAGLDDPTGQQAKAALERHYDDRIRPKTFHGALEALVTDGFLSRRQDGLADRYALTDAGEQHLRAHHEWVGANLPSDGVGEGGGDGAGSDGEAPVAADDVSTRASGSHGGDGKENR
ncbi:PadR family transcriptional regulator [Salinigranum sp.]|uniref:PadR family transcriptional regulator n=1 Tax=Salinigranum sp. TaxID=1966351 RepID=UPI0035629C91